MDVNVDNFVAGIGQIMGVNVPAELASLFSGEQPPNNDMNDVQKTIASVCRLMSIVFKASKNMGKENEGSTNHQNSSGVQGLQGPQGPQGEDGVADVTSDYTWTGKHTFRYGTFFNSYEQNNITCFNFISNSH